MVVRVWGGEQIFQATQCLEPCQPASQLAASRSHDKELCWGFESCAKSPKVKLDESALFLATFLKAFSTDACFCPSYQGFKQAQLEAYPFLTHGMGIHIFPSCSGSLGPGFPAQMVLPADCLNGLSSSSHCPDEEPLLDWRLMGVQRFDTKPSEKGPVSISLTLYILCEYPPFSPTDPQMEHC